MGRYNPEIHHRRSLRLENYDYSQLGAYFVTICVKDRIERFGEIIDDRMHLSEQGRIAQYEWNNLSRRFPGIELDHYVIMPNHVHGILIRTQRIKPPIRDEPSSVISHTTGILRTQRIDPMRSQKLHEIMRTFKAVVSCRIHKSATPEFAWQREYYDHIIRNQQQLDRIRTYIINNPTTWRKDSLRPPR